MPVCVFSQEPGRILDEEIQAERGAGQPKSEFVERAWLANFSYLGMRDQGRKDR